MSFDTSEQIPTESGGERADTGIVQSFEDAYRACLALVAGMPRLPQSQRGLTMATGRILAQPVAPNHALPPADTAMVDGYAVQVRDLAGPGPWAFKVCGEIEPGLRPSAEIIHRKSALRIAAGARLVPPFDHVIPIGSAERNGSQVTVSEASEGASNVLRVGTIAKPGEPVVLPGVLLNACDIGVIAATGIEQVSVLRKLRVALLSVGSGLSEVGARFDPVMTPDTNRPMIEAGLSERWIELRDFGIVPEGPDALRLALDLASGWADAIITTGGTSGDAGGRLASALSTLDAVTCVPGINMAPGGTTIIGKIGGSLLMGLPGAPLAAKVVMTTLVDAVLAHRAGLSVREPQFRRGVAAERITSAVGSTSFHPVQGTGENRAGLPVLRLHPLQSATDLRAMARADGIARIAPTTAVLDAGQELIWFPFRACNT